VGSGIHVAGLTPNVPRKECVKGYTYTTLGKSKKFVDRSGATDAYVLGQRVRDGIGVPVPVP
jgi:hypothetical protein